MYWLGVVVTVGTVVLEDEQHWGLLCSYPSFPILSLMLSPSALVIMKQGNHSAALIQAKAVLLQFLLSSWLMDSSRI